jgi:hypothetical protein
LEVRVIQHLGLDLRKDALNGIEPRAVGWELHQGKRFSLEIGFKGFGAMNPPAVQDEVEVAPGVTLAEKVQEANDLLGPLPLKESKPELAAMYVPGCQEFGLAFDALFGGKAVSSGTPSSPPIGFKDHGPFLIERKDPRLGRLAIQKALHPFFSRQTEDLD